MPELRDIVDTACAGVGRDPAEIERSVSLLVDLSGHGEVPWSMFPDPVIPLSGSPEQIAAEFEAFADEGIRHLQIYLVSVHKRGVLPGSWAGHKRRVRGWCNF